ncbi:MAG: hypothetical protein GXP28_06090 [Planctomycetes bacterium]|nr:hypothetical protein [Planctomycetota bacterium]
MGRITETVRTANSLLRTLLFGILVAGAGLAGWQGYSLYNEPQKKLAEKQHELEGLRESLAAREREMTRLSTDLKEKIERIDRIETSMRLLKLKHRIARLEVIDQKPLESEEGEDSGQVITTIEFYEVNEEGASVDGRRRRFEIEGDRVYIECLVAKFEDKYVEQADLERSTAICLFQRIFGENQEPREGFQLDEVGSSPTSYARGGKVSEFEQKIWDDFWNIASDRKKAAAIGIRAAHAIAPSTQVRKGVTYELELRSTGEFTLMPLAGDHQ